jgi:hypothetical protein
MKKIALLPLLLLALASLPPTDAASIYIENPGFEALTGSDTNHFDPNGRLKLEHYSARFSSIPQAPETYFTSVPIPGWKITSPGTTANGTYEAGTYRPSTPRLPSGPPEGAMIAYVNAAYPTNMISQTLCRVLTPGTYTLLVDVVRPTFDSSRITYSVQLLAGGRVLAQDNNGHPPAVGGFSTSTCVATVLSNSPVLGRPLEVRLIANGYNPVLVGDQICFDNVRLDGPPGPCVQIRHAIEISWSLAESNKLYQVQWAPNAASTNWTALEIPITWSGTTNRVPGNGGIRAVFDSIYGQEARVYRILELP